MGGAIQRNASARDRRLPVVAFVTLLAIGCVRSPVTVERASPDRVYQQLTANALSGDRPSTSSVQVLYRLSLGDRFDRDPPGALSALRAEWLADPSPSLLFALAELSFLYAHESGDRSHFLASAVYAIAFLAQSAKHGLASSLDPRFRLAADLYNRALAAGLASDDGEFVSLEPRLLELPFGTLDLGIVPEQFIWGGFRLVDFVPVADLEVRGLRNHYRDAGLGAPLAASLAPLEAGPIPAAHKFISRRSKVPATVLLRIPNVDQAIREDRLLGMLDLRTLESSRFLEVGGENIPLEYEPSAALAYGLASSRFWEFERRGFFTGDFGRAREHGLILIYPYHPGRIPVVLVHGTASSPGRWANLLNDLQSDPFVFEHFQFWLFQYNTGNPVAFSAGLLRESLVDAVQTLDPSGSDPALRNLVVIGHSQGGLLAKLTVVDSGTRFWDTISNRSIDDLELEPETREILERSVFVEPLPFVRRVIFIATPHRGSFQTERALAGLLSRFISLPADLVSAGRDLVASDDSVARRSFEKLPSSLDNMRPSNRFLNILVKLPIDPAVSAHSIIAIQGDGPVEKGNDGVVEYSSAHLDGVESEFIVRSGHSVQSNPATVREVRRILYEQAESMGVRTP